MSILGGTVLARDGAAVAPPARSYFFTVRGSNPTSAAISFHVAAR